jgi:hypothetical protein
LILTNSRVLQNTEIDVVDTVGAQDVSSRVTHSLSRRDWREQRTPAGAKYFSTLIDERSRVVFTFGLIALPTNAEMLANAPAGSEPFSGVNGEPLCNENCELSCQPPSTRPANPFWSR